MLVDNILSLFSQFSLEDQNRFKTKLMKFSRKQPESSMESYHELLAFLGIELPGMEEKEMYPLLNSYELQSGYMADFKVKFSIL